PVFFKQILRDGKIPCLIVIFWKFPKNFIIFSVLSAIAFLIPNLWDGYESLGGVTLIFQAEGTPFDKSFARKLYLTS
ncbi:hypothetical protein, partial [Novacetimonas hansenii]|uniref:hypothetical protein n=1 Tax=Novacetimonas hansenii TaxID=436 RepID=UPI001C3FE910